ncbi:MAG TPA: ABC transporter permease [Bryobacteraceae bacterium]|nr:ABC transporter permease [Bryobacteraceae bacterium]
MSFRKIAWLFRRRSRESELADELQFHLSEEAEDRGMDAARRELGNLGLIQEDTRAEWGWTWFDQLAQDVRYAVRTMLRNPAFTLLAALSLALGIGANTAIYSFMDALLFRDLPVADPRSLVVLNFHRKDGPSVVHAMSGSIYDDPKYGQSARIFPYPAFELFQKSTATLASIFAYYPARGLNLVIDNQAEIVNGQFVSGDYFGGLELVPGAGRLVFPSDDRAGAPPVVVLGFDYSARRFGDPARAVGRSILIDNVPFTVAGVAPPRFSGVDPSLAAQFFIPLHMNIVLGPEHNGRSMRERYEQTDYYWLEMMGRLRPGVTMAQAQGELAPVFARWVATTAKKDQERANLPGLYLSSGATGIDELRRRYSEPVYVLLAMVGLILAIACANVANLLLARATARRREMAVRLSMGAGRWRVIRQLLTESVLLATLAGAAGMLVALWGVRFLAVLLSARDARFTLHPDLNWHVLAAAAALSVLTGVLFGLAPAIQATRVDVMPMLKEARAADRRPRGSIVRLSPSHVLVVSQIAIALLLVLAAGLFLRTLSNLQSIALGFNRDHVLVFKLNARQAGHRDPEIIAFYSDLERRFRAIPGVLGATVTNSPLVGEGTWSSPAYALGREPSLQQMQGHGSSSEDRYTRILTAGPGFFSVMKIPILAGREFEDRDQAGSPPVAIVNQAWAKYGLDNENPVGRQIVVGIIRQGKPEFQQFEVVGLAKDSRYGDLTGEYPPTVYLAFRQNLYYPAQEMTYFLRTSGDPLSYADAARQIVQQADPRVPVMSVTTQSAAVDHTMGAEILFARLCTVFAFLALTIACVGLYGTMSYMVARRTGEIGIRMALGAPRGRVVWMVMAQVIAMAVAGLAIGIPAAYASSRLVKSLLYGVKANDSASLAVAIATLVAATLIAGFGPARRASRIDPVVALRHE